MTHDQKRSRLTSRKSKVSADWHELMTPERITRMRPFIARISEHLDPPCSTHRPNHPVNSP